jgi:LuxR family transcriptional regulator, maltose regulon positive regulatory protein
MQVMAALASPLAPTARPLPARLQVPLPAVAPVLRPASAPRPGRTSARTGFARTKIQPPRPRPGHWQARPLLEARVAEALSTQRLVLVQAAAGYGKTSLLARQAQALPAGTALAWVSCDLGDSPLGLFQCLVGALEPFDLPWRVEPEALMAAAAGDGTPAARNRALRTMVAALINALDACDVPHGVIVVDDLHRIDHAEVHDFLDLLLERFTPRWTLALATRHEPPIALSRLRALGEVTEFRLEDLRFERDETPSLLCGAGLDSATAEALFERTQGWPVALSLHSMTGPRAVPATALPLAAQALERPMFEFLAAEVFDRMAPDLRRFLLQTSLLPELSAARCAALTGDPRAGRLLEQVERAGLAVSVVGGPELTLRLHDLLRDALQQRLLREHPDDVAGLCARAAAGEPDPGRRIDYLLRAGDPAAAAQALLEHTPALLVQGAAPAVQRLLDRADAGVAAAGGLSSREGEVLARLAAGDSNKLIARALDLSPHTVKRHVANILDKLDLQSRGQAAAWYQQQRHPGRP